METGVNKPATAAYHCSALLSELHCRRRVEENVRFILQKLQGFFAQTETIVFEVARNCNKFLLQSWMGIPDIVEYLN